MMDFDKRLDDNHSLSINQINHSSDIFYELIVPVVGELAVAIFEIGILPAR